MEARLQVFLTGSSQVVQQARASGAAPGLPVGQGQRRGLYPRARSITCYKLRHQSQGLLPAHLQRPSSTVPGCVDVDNSLRGSQRLASQPPAGAVPWQLPECTGDG